MEPAADQPAPSIYRGQQAVLATMHAKERAITGPLRDTLGLTVTLAPVDTDALGTFTGEIERPGTMLETAIAKARLGMRQTGARLGLASEGSYGPHPFAPFLPSGTELLVLVDDANGFVIHEARICETTNFDHAIARDIGALESFLARVGFPEHGLVVQPNDPVHGPRERLDGAIRRVARMPPFARLLGSTLPDVPIHKGLRTRTDLQTALDHCARASKDGLARVTTDMRAFMNPTRMDAIASLAQRLADRIATPCPACRAPGFGPREPKRGLPCSQCGYATDLVLADVWGCITCDHTVERPRPDGAVTADPTWCPWCNP